MYSSTLSLASALDGDGWSTPLQLSPWGRTRYPLYRRLDGPQRRSGQVLKIEPSSGFDLRTFQVVAGRYPDSLLTH